MPAPTVEQPLSPRLKRCAKCERLRPFGRFYRCQRSPDGLFNECKACHSERRERNRKLQRLGGPLTFTTAGRLRGILFSAMELGVRSHKTLPQTLDVILELLAHAERERDDEAARRTLWDEIRAFLLELPHTERLEILKKLATTLPPTMRPKFKGSDTAPSSSDSPSSAASA